MSIYYIGILRHDHYNNTQQLAIYILYLYKTQDRDEYDTTVPESVVKRSHQEG
jgi:hypothetical protein